MRKIDINQQLSLMPVWIKSAEVTAILEVHKNAVYQLMQRGIIRAKRNVQRHWYYFRDDVHYVYVKRASVQNVKGAKLYETLFQRGLCPEALKGKSGEDVVKWAEEFAPGTLESKLQFSVTAYPREDAKGKLNPEQSVDPLARITQLEANLKQLKAVMEGVMAWRGIDTKLATLSHTDCAAIVTRCKRYATKMMTRDEIAALSNILIRLSDLHIAQIRSWPQDDPEGAANVLDPGEAAYLWVYKASKVALLQAQNLPGATLQGSNSWSLVKACEKAHVLIQRLVSNQAGIDFYLSNHGKTLPVPFAPTDQYILSHVVPNPRLDDVL